MAVETLPHDDFELLTVREGATLLRLPVSSVYELVRNRRLPFVRIGRRIFFVRGELIRWVRQEMSVRPRLRP